MNIQMMGVINITPNSFSDGGVAFNHEGLVHRLELLTPYCEILDIGAESTAPMNESVPYTEERKRLNQFFSTIDEMNFLKTYEGNFSLDSFRSENVFWFFKELEKRGVSNRRFIWNDVSGLWDDSVNKFLQDYPLSRYVFCHNEAKSRIHAGNHMDYIFDGPIKELIPHLYSFFHHGLSLGEASFNKNYGRVFLDPCFGFSKSYEQNLFLLTHWTELIEKFPHNDFVFGISKKSFLRRYIESNFYSVNKNRTIVNKTELLDKSEYLHLLSLQETIERSRNKSLKNLVIRLHDPILGLISKVSFKNI